MEGEKLPRISRKGIQEYLNKEMPHVELQNITAKGLITDHARKGFVRCTFIIPPSASEEVEIVAKVVGNKGKLNPTRVEVKKKDDGELIAIAKQWTASNEFRAPWINHPSKL
ncbi:hypothetical protein ES288_D05G140500v1 [Gossypium darwinii]|uniref:Uncharacterized protein n=1 Tax=Gossypium darwinii TaxID=34276 RepID=A0A5D2CJ07_GOSDA|nr:hypothetical protein ES288_D05G140500v1 [Gossypium darwinii]